VHLKYLDGLRGWASLFVVFHHFWQFVVGQVERGRLPPWFRLMTVFKFGPLAVTVFIVLSGYSLMIPVVRTSDAAFADGLLGFLRRRARRILPPYYAALAFSVLLLFIFAPLRQPTGTQWDIALPALTLPNLSLHVLLLHNLFQAWQWKLNPPLWSVALEWQIYFLFALVLLPVWRRIGPHATLLFACALCVLPVAWGGAFAHPWYVGSFALGMWAAAGNFSTKLSASTWMAKTPWGVVCVAFLIPVALWLVVLKGDLNDVVHWIPLAAVHSCASIATAAFLIHSTGALMRNRQSTVVRGMSHPWSVTLGGFSYSLYLLHYPLVAVLCVILRVLGVSLAPTFVLLAFVGTPMILVICYAFHLLFEKPYMRPHTVRRDATKGNAVATSVEPSAPRRIDPSGASLGSPW
jgi:peptidoglycan/LPS O-acetylase OafA/YrhL